MSAAAPAVKYRRAVPLFLLVVACLAGLDSPAKGGIAHRFAPIGDRIIDRGGESNARHARSTLRARGALSAQTFLLHAGRVGIGSSARTSLMPLALWTRRSGAVPTAALRNATLATPTVGLSAATGLAGSSVTASGANFHAGATVNLTWWTCAPSCVQLLALGGTTASGSGSFAASITIPSTASPGFYYVIATEAGGTFGNVAGFTVTPTGPTANLWMSTAGGSCTRFDDRGGFQPGYILLDGRRRIQRLPAGRYRQDQGGFVRFAIPSGHEGLARLRFQG